MRTSIILHKSLTSGEAANVAAILMGELVKQSGDQYHDTILRDQAGNMHARIKNSVAILKSKSEAKLHTISQLVEEEPDLKLAVFTKNGMSLNNEYHAYRQIIEHSEPSKIMLAGIAIFGNDEKVRALTHQFSSYQ